MDDVNPREFSISLSLPDLKNFTGWATFVAITDIIAGALACLGIITAAYGVPQIISGVKLLNAVEDLKRYMTANDIQKVSDAFHNMYKYFKLSGISVIIKIVFIILGIILYGIMIAYFITHMPELMRTRPNMPRF